MTPTRLFQIGIAAHLASLLVLAASVWAAPAEDERFLAGLRSRGLFELAEKHCAERLADQRISDDERTVLSIELARTLAEHALDAQDAEASRLWQASRRVVEEFAARNPKHPKLILVDFQGALAVAARGAAEREQLEGSNEPQALEAARGSARTAIAALRRLADRITADLNRRGRAAPGELTTAELQSLEANVRYELGRALRNQALCYQPGTADRINSLSQAVESLAVVASAQPRTPLVWSAAIEQIACLRLLGEYPTAERALTKLEKSQPPDEFSQRLRAERIRLALDRGRIDEALSEAGGAQQHSGPEAELARLEALLAAFRQADQRAGSPDAAGWQKRAAEQVRAIERAYGRRTTRQAESLLARSLAGARTRQTADTLAQSAASYYRGGQPDKAVAAYDQAAQQAREERQPERAFELAFTAAAIEHQRQHYREGLARLLTLSARPAAPKAADAHLLAIHCAAQLAQAESPPNLEQYEKLLREHVSTWPQSPTAAQAWSWLGRLAENRRDWAKAVEAFGQVKEADSQFADAITAIGRCYEAWLDELRERGQDGERLANDALANFERASGATKKSTPATRAAALAAARIWLKEMPTGALPAERLLSDAMRDKQAPQEWQTAVRCWLVAALAAQGKQQEADDVAAELPRNSAGRLALVTALAEVASRAAPDVARKLAPSALAAQEDLLARKDELDAGTLREVTRDRAVTLAALGRRKEAVETLESLAAGNPRDGQTQEALARLLAAGDGEDLQTAIVKWREVASRSRPGTPRWFRAHYELAHTQLRAGQPSDARKTLDQVAAKDPNLGGAALKEQFDRLSDELDDGAKK